MLMLVLMLILVLILVVVLTILLKFPPLYLDCGRSFVGGNGRAIVLPAMGHEIYPSAAT